MTTAARRVRTIALAVVSALLYASPSPAEERIIWIPVSPPQQSAPPRAPVQIQGTIEVTYRDGKRHALTEASLGTEDTQFGAGALQITQAELDSMFILPLNTVSRKNRKNPPWECYYSILIPLHRIKTVAARPRDESGFEFPIEVTLRDSPEVQVVGEAYGSATKFWRFHLTGTEKLGGFGDQKVSGFLGPTNGVGHVQFVSVSLPELPVAPELKTRSSRSATVVDVSSRKHGLTDIRIPAVFRCQNAGGTIEVPLEKIARISAVRNNDTIPPIHTTWTVTLRTGETSEFSFIGIFGIAGRGEHYFECIPVDSISSIDFDAPSDKAAGQTERETKD
ncbi:MAG TPA: hypothetical protein PLU30_08890 [Verrucomicrobiae bacterium]|nr:hypothetical protein [Verrucomicrobiae bacterium]